MILAPSHDCRHSELASQFVAELEARLGRPVEWAAWSHRSPDLIGSPHVHVVVRDPRADPTDKRQFVRLEAKIQRAAEYAYAGIRERQREYARRQERDAPQHERL